MSNKNPTHPIRPKITPGRIVRIATAVLAGAVIAALPATAEARPTVDHHGGSADRGDCHVTYTHDRGYLYVIRVVRFGEPVERTVRIMPTSPSSYALVETIDLGLVRSVTCGYQR